MSRAAIAEASKPFGDRWLRARVASGVVHATIAGNTVGRRRSMLAVLGRAVCVFGSESP